MRRVTVTSKILPSAALLIVLAVGDGVFTSRVSAGGGAGSTVTWLPTLGGTTSQGYEVSSTGSVVVGYASNASGQYRAFRWTTTGAMQDLGDFGYAYAAA
jgi:probable HAF family extracellular repeat protein